MNTASHSSAHAGPYAQAAGDYWAADWKPLPLPPRSKELHLRGYTGNDGDDPTWPDVVAWTDGHEGRGNIALRLPDNVLGLDIDDYDDKPGAATLASGERVWGPLPATWRTTSRDDGVSGIRLYRVPPGLRWPGGFGPGTETIRRGHRYAVAPPSIHPEGRTYRWITPDGATSLHPPRPSDLPELPTTWVVGLTQNRTAVAYQEADMDDSEVREWLVEHSHGEPCDVMADARDALLADMRAGAHESLRLLMRVVGSGAAGHDGLTPALKTVHDAFVATVRARRGGTDITEDEWRRSLGGAVRKVVGEMTKTGTRTSRIDPCEVLVSPAAAPGAPEALSAQPGSGGEFSVVSPAPAAAATTASSPLSGDVLSAPAPGAGADASGPEGGNDSLDSSADDVPSDHDDGGETPEQARERAIVGKLAELELLQEAKLRLAAKNAPPLEVLDADEFLDSPTPEPLVPNLLYKDSLTRIFGAPGCGKSFLSLDLAFHVALGRDWRDKPVERTRVIYVMAEGQRVNTARAQAWLERHQVGRDELRGWFYTVPHKVLLTEDAVRDLVAKVAELKAGLVFLDTKNAMMVGDENNASDFAIVRRAMDLVREASDASVVLIDHTGYGDPRRARGSSAGTGGVDTEVLVENNGEKPPLVTVTTTRDKGDEDGTQWEFYLRTHPLPDGKPAAVLLAPDEEVDRPEKRLTAAEAETSWRNHDRPIPTEVLAYDGGPAVTAAMPDLARYMAHDAGPAGDPDGIGKKMSDAVRALSPKVMGGGGGHSRSTVERAWSALRGMGYIEPVELGGEDDPEKAASIRRKQTTGKHVWVRR